MKKLFKLLTSKLPLTLLLIILQIATFVVIAFVLTNGSIWVYIGFNILSLFVSLYIMSKEDNPAYKLAWIVPILAFPLFGGLMYLLYGRQKIKRKMRKRILKKSADMEKLFETHDSKINAVEALSPEQAKLADYVKNASYFPVFKNTETEYFRIGEDYYAALIEELKKAEKFIFMEYFIIDKGRFWNDVLEILREKVINGVDVRIIYDDVGCMFTLPSKYYKQLKKIGIKAVSFNKFKVSFDISMNNRSHRKICVIDGNVAFTGGINIADEYINAVERFGHWKDTGMKFTGPACRSFTIMFLSFWSIQNNDETIEQYEAFLPEVESAETPAVGLVQPLSGGPNGKEQIIESAFMQMINSANEYVYICTPYLILDNELVTALCISAKSGVDVRIMMPHIPDKKMIFMMSRSFYPVLLKAGVKIFEYTPGFVHAKSVISDGKTAFIGSCNMDYRSFYLHYECGALLYNTKSIEDMKKDFDNTLKKCHEVTYREANDVTIFTRLARTVLRVFAPML